MFEQTAFGLDIGSSDISVLKIKEKRGRLVLAGFCRSFLPSGLVRVGRIQDEKYLVDLVRKAAAASRPKKIRDFYVNLTLPESCYFLQIVQLPKMKEEEASQAIKWEIEANIPLPIDAVYYDWKIMETKAKEKIDHLNVVIAAAPKEVVDSYIRVIKQAGFFPKSVEIDSFSLCRSLVPGIRSDSPVLVVELSASQATLVVFSGNTPRFSSSIPVSGRYFAEMAAGKWGAEEKKKKTDSLTEKKFLPIFANFLAEQIRTYIEFYDDHSEHDRQDGLPKIKKILLCGGGIFAGLPEFLKEKLKIETEIGNPFVNISKNPRSDFGLISVEESLALSKVLGLAARDFL